MPRFLTLMAPLLGLLLITAQSADAVAQEVQGAWECSGSGWLVRLGRPATTVFAAASQIADVQTAAADRLFVFGKKPGCTMLFALDDCDEPIVSWQTQVETEHAALDGRAGAQSDSASVSMATMPDGAVLTGRVPSSATAVRLAALVRQPRGAGREVSNQ